MKNPLTRGLAILALSSLMFVQIAQATTGETEDPYTDDPAITVTLTGSLTADGKVNLSWTQYTGANFQWYKVVTSQTDDSPKYPENGYIDVKTAATDLTYIHTNVPAGVNYYSVCVITTDSKRGCSNTVTINKGAATTPVVEDNDPYTDDSTILLTLTGALNADGKAVLNWTKYSGTDLKWYKVVHSQTDDSPKYPENGYVEVFSDVNILTYTHTAVPAGTNYYSVCVITTADKRGCSNTVTLTKGEGTVPTSTTTAAFPDVEDHWAKDYVTQLYNDGVVEGRDGSFEPDEPVLRSEAVKMILMGLGYQPVTCDSSLFPDLKDGDWFCGVVTKAFALGVIQGDNGYLFPARDITRAEALKILITTKGFELPTLETSPFSDVKAGDWYLGYVNKASILGWIEGVDGKFEPNRYITRAELAKLVALASN